MNNKNWILTAFILLALAQLYVPAHMIFSREEILETGDTYKFDVAPVDPNDPFRGKYIRLRYAENTVAIPEGTHWQANESVYVILTRDKNGYARIKGVSKTRPEDSHYVAAKVDNVFNNTLIIQYPFNRLYMEETKAYEAEMLYRGALQDSSRQAYAIVSVKDGDAVLQDVYINEIPLKELVDKGQ